MPALPLSFDLDLDGIHRSMEDYSSGSAGMGMSPYNVTPLWLILNMPTASPSTAEKWGHKRRRERQQSRPACTAEAQAQELAPRKVRSDKGKKCEQPAPQRGQNAAPCKVHSDKGKKHGPHST
jgi:hypothetical protein